MPRRPLSQRRQARSPRALPIPREPPHPRRRPGTPASHPQGSARASNRNAYLNRRVREKVPSVMAQIASYPCTWPALGPVAARPGSLCGAVGRAGARDGRRVAQPARRRSHDRSAGGLRCAGGIDPRPRRCRPPERQLWTGWDERAVRRVLEPQNSLRLAR